MQPKKILYIDMDGVIADFESAVEEIHPGIFDLVQKNPNQNENLIDDICKSNPNILRNLNPIPGSIDAVNYLSPVYDIYFLSTPMWVVPESFMDKRLWIHDHFGASAEKRLILTHRKDLAIGDYLIDDRLVNGAANFVGEHIHFRTIIYPDWDSVVNYLESKTTFYHV